MRQARRHQLPLGAPRGIFRLTGDIFGPMKRRGGQPPCTNMGTYVSTILPRTCIVTWRIKRRRPFARASLTRPRRWRSLTAQIRWRSLQACDALPAPASHPSMRPVEVGENGPAPSPTRLFHASPRSWAGIAAAMTSVSTLTAPIQRSRLQSSSFGRRCITPKPSSRQAPLPRPSSASSLPSRASERGCRPTSVVSCI